MRGSGRRCARSWGWPPRRSNGHSCTSSNTRSPERCRRACSPEPSRTSRVSRSPLATGRGHRSTPSTVATVVYAELDLVDNIVHYACAGHPPPVVVRDGNVLDLMEGRTTPLAALPDPVPVEEATHPFPPGSLLLLYSDGLIERRGEPLDVGMRRLHALLAELPSEPPDTLADLL